jgi:hypothetical protein
VDFASGGGDVGVTDEHADIKGEIDQTPRDQEFHNIMLGHLQSRLRGAVKAIREKFKKEPDTEIMAVARAVEAEGNSNAITQRRLRKPQNRLEDSEKDEKKDESKKDESKKDESKKDESKKDESKKDEKKEHEPGTTWGSGDEWFAKTPEGNVVGPLKKEKAEDWASGEVGDKSKKASLPGYDMTPWPELGWRR